MSCIYEGYKKRLETKLKHKSTQIARDQHLLETLPDSQKQAIKATMQTAMREQDEIQKLLDQIREQIDGLKKDE